MANVSANLVQISHLLGFTFAMKWPQNGRVAVIFLPLGLSLDIQIVTPVVNLDFCDHDRLRINVVIQVLQDLRIQLPAYGQLCFCAKHGFWTLSHTVKFIHSRRLSNSIQVVVNVQAA